MFTGVVVGGIILITALVAFSHWCCYRAGKDVGYEEGRADRSAEELAARAEKRHEARHARTQPRTAPERTTLVREPARITWDRDEAVGGPVEIPGKWYADQIRKRMATVDLVLPEPGTYLPQPGRDSGPGTLTFGKLELPATTGEMAAVTDQYIADMAVEEETYRLGLAT